MIYYGVLVERSREAWLLADHWFETPGEARVWARRNWHGFPVRIVTLSDVLPESAP